MKFTDKTITTIEKVGTLDLNENGDYILTIESKDSFNEYNVIEDILPLLVGKMCSFKSEEIEEG